MDSNNEALCLDELDHLILDADKKINLQYISNTWNVPFKVSESILQKWLDNYKDGKNVAKEFLIRGTDKKNNAVIMVVPESKLAKIEEICPNAVHFLYSVEIASLNGKSLNLPVPTENKFITLKANFERRDITVNGTVVPSANKAPVENKPEPIDKKPEPTKKPTTSIFNTAKPKQQKQPEIKTEKTSSVHPKPAEHEKKVTPERKSPRKSPRKNQSNTKPNQVKSIANFFGSKPTSSSADKKATAKAVAEATVKIETVEIKDEPEANTKSSDKSSKNPHKRNLSNASDSNEEKIKTEKESDRQMPSKKKIKLERKSAKSRLMQICDSSSDEEEIQQKQSVDEMSVDEDEVPVKKQKENKTPSPQKNQNTKANAINGNSGNGNSTIVKGRAKVKKMVTRTYEDEDGFINTVREMEEVSCSDDEPEPAAVEPTAKKTAPAATTSTNTKKKISPPVGKKQGSILSFFGKK